MLFAYGKRQGFRLQVTILKAMTHLPVIYRSSYNDSIAALTGEALECVAKVIKISQMSFI